MQRSVASLTLHFCLAFVLSVLGTGKISRAKGDVDWSVTRVPVQNATAKATVKRNRMYGDGQKPRSS